MSIKIFEDTHTLNVDGLFLPPVVATVKYASVDTLNIISSAVILLSLLVIWLNAPVFGILAIVIGILLVTASVLATVAARKPKNSFGTPILSTAFFVSAILCLLSAILFGAFSYGILPDVTLPFISKLPSMLPSTLTKAVSCSAYEFPLIFTALAITFLATALSYNSLNRSRKLNRPLTKALLFSALLGFLTSAFFITDAVSRFLAKPCLSYAQAKSTDFSTLQLPEGLLRIALAIGIALSSINLMIIYIRIRKVRNVILKAKI